MKNITLLVFACALVSITQIHGYCEDNQNRLATIINNSDYKVTEQQGYEKNGTLRTNVLSPSQSMNIKTPVGGPKSQARPNPGSVTIVSEYPTNHFLLEDTSDGLAIIKDGKNLAPDGKAIHGCGMDLEITYNYNGSTHLKLTDRQTSKILWEQ